MIHYTDITKFYKLFNWIFALGFHFLFQRERECVFFTRSDAPAVKKHVTSITQNIDVKRVIHGF